MKVLDRPLLLDENVPAAVAERLRLEGRDVSTAGNAGLLGADDAAIMAAAQEAGRCIVTQDRDFGRLAIRRGLTCPGIVFLRPGHVEPAIVLEMLGATSTVEIPSSPFVMVVHRRKGRLMVRVRPLTS